MQGWDESSSGRNLLGRRWRRGALQGTAASSSTRAPLSLRGAAVASTRAGFPWWQRGDSQPLWLHFLCISHMGALLFFSLFWLDEPWVLLWGTGQSVLQLPSWEGQAA